MPTNRPSRPMSPYLNESQAFSMMRDILDGYEKRTGVKPRRAPRVDPPRPHPLDRCRPAPRFRAADLRRRDQFRLGHAVPRPCPVGPAVLGHAVAKSFVSGLELLVLAGRDIDHGLRRRQS